MVTMLGMDLGQLIGGAVLVETVYSLQGLGEYATRALHHGDLYALMDVSIIVGVAIAVANLVVDLLYARIDPRVRYR
jgi:peptide/nickel transport system permease protein